MCDDFRYALQVQPDMEELTENEGEPDEAESKQSEIKLGRLQYKVSVLGCRCVSCNDVLWH